eukprot:551703_1
MSLSQPPKKKRKFGEVEPIYVVSPCYSCDDISFVNNDNLCQECEQYNLCDDFNLLIKFKESIQEINKYFNLKNNIKTLIATIYSDCSNVVEIEIVSQIFAYSSPCEYFQNCYQRNIKELFTNNFQLLITNQLKNINVSRANIDTIFKDACHIINDIEPTCKYYADEKPFRLALNLCSILYYKKYIKGNLIISSGHNTCEGEIYAELKYVITEQVDLEKRYMTHLGDDYINFTHIGYQNHENIKNISKNLYYLLNNQSVTEFVYSCCMDDGKFHNTDGEIEDLEALIQAEMEQGIARGENWG